MKRCDRTGVEWVGSLAIVRWSAEGEEIMTALELHSGQLWVPKSGSVWSAGVSSRFPMGTEVLTWFKTGHDGHCTARAFRRWIKHTEATRR